MIAKREALNLGKELVAKFKGQILPHPFGHVGLGEGKEAAHYRKEQQERDAAVECPFGTGACRQIQASLGGVHCLGHRIQDILYHLGHQQLGTNAQQQGQIGNRCRPTITSQVTDSAA